MSDPSLFLRAPVGFVVEGEGEYQAYPVLVSRICSANGMLIPIAVGGGWAGVVDELEEHLDDVVRRASPMAIVVTLDAIDPVKAGRFSSFLTLKDNLTERGIRWLASSRCVGKHGRVLCIEVVLQVLKFETWLIADLAALSTHAAFAGVPLQPWEDGCCDIDTLVGDPVNWIDARTVRKLDTKKPPVVKGLASSLSVVSATKFSASFRSFASVVRREYDQWLAQCCAK